MKKKLRFAAALKKPNECIILHTRTHILLLYIYRRYLYTIKHIINYVYNRARIGFAAVLRKRRRSVVLFFIIIIIAIIGYCYCCSRAIG